jgi:hypothetical protein
MLLLRRRAAHPEVALRWTTELILLLSLLRWTTEKVLRLLLASHAKVGLLGTTECIRLRLRPRGRTVAK